MRRSRFIDFAVYLVVRLLICVVQALRLQTSARLAHWLAWLFCDVIRLRRRVVDDNLQIAYPSASPQERHRLAFAMWEHLFLMVVEIAHASRKIHVTNWRRHVQLLNPELMVRALLADRPAVIVTGHYGNFELSGYVLGLFGFPTYTVARTLDNPYLNAFVNRFRGQRGQHILPKQGSADEIAGMLATGGTLAVLADQSAGPKGCWVDFFGRPASTHKAIAVFALSYDAPLVLGYARRVGGPLQYVLGTHRLYDPRSLSTDEPPISALTQQFTCGLEEVIREAPEQYWWIHRRWKDTREKRAPRQAA